MALQNSELAGQRIFDLGDGTWPDLATAPASRLDDRNILYRTNERDYEPTGRLKEGWTTMPCCTPIPFTGPAIAWFEQATASETDCAGGKGASLSRMTTAGLPVPPGFVVCAGAFQEFLRSAQAAYVGANQSTNSGDPSAIGVSVTREFPGSCNGV